MSNRWPAGLIRKTPVTPAGPYQDSAAPGVWTLAEAAYWQKQGLWPGMTDANFENVTLLLPGNGSNGAQNNTFIDASTNNFTITRNGDTTQGSFSPYGNLWSNYFDGSGDYLSVANNAAFDFGTGNFTIEGWVYIAANSSQNASGNRVANIASTLRQTSPSGFEFIIDGDSSTTGTGIYFKGWVNGTSYQVGATTTIAQNTLNHLAVVRNGTTTTIYVNGVSVASGTLGNQTITPANDLWIAGNNSPSYTHYLNGYISNLRVVKGTAVYTANFTPPTAPLTAISGTSLLTCQSNRFRDASANNFTITVNGNTSVTNFAPFNPTNAYSTATNGGSGYFDGTGDYLSAPSSSALEPGSGDFTIEAWIYPLSYPASGTGAAIADRSNASGYANFTVNLRSNGAIEAYFSLSNTSSIPNIITAGNCPIGAWTHVAFVKSGLTRTLYINGVQVGTVTSASNPPTGLSTITKIGQGDGTLNGYLSNVRIAQSAVYTTTFTPPTVPLTAITNTSLLLNFTNAGIVDASAKNDLRTVGNAQISTAQSKFGGSSMYFDGSGDYLKMPASPAFNFGTGDFTIEAWIYPIASATAAGETYYPIVGSDASFGVGFTYNWLFVYVNQGGLNKFRFSRKVSASPGGGSDVNLESSTVALNYNQWQHVAVTRSNGTVYFFSNGNAIGSVAYTGDISITQGLTVNAAFGGSTYQSVQWLPQGYTDDLRITKGVARYTTSFTPLNAPFPTK